MRQEVHQKVLPGRPHEGAHQGEAVLLSDMRKDRRHAVKLQLAPEDSHHQGTCQHGGIDGFSNKQVSATCLQTCVILPKQLDGTLAHILGDENPSWMTTLFAVKGSTHWSPSSDRCSLP